MTDFNARRNAPWNGQKPLKKASETLPIAPQSAPEGPFSRPKMNYEMTLEGVVSCFPEASPEDGKVSGVTTRCCT